MGNNDDAVPENAIAKPIMEALGTLLSGSTASVNTEGQPGVGGLLESLAGGLSQQGGMLGGLGDLMGKLENAGLADTVNSWLSSGENAAIAPDELGKAVGSETVGNLARQAGVSENDLLEQLSNILPGLVDQLTPDGKLPDTDQIANWLGKAFKA